MRAALELFSARHYPVVVAVCGDALVDDPDNLHLRLLRARALVSLRRDREAQAEIGVVVALEPGCAQAYQLLGELAVRRDEIAAATIFFREALRLAPDEPEAREWLTVVQGLVRSTSAAARPPAAAAGVAPLPRRGPPPVPTRAAPRARARGTASPVAPSRRPHTAPLPSTLSQLPMARGFGGYLVETGVLSPLQLRAALAYEKSTGVRLGAAAVALGFASEMKIEWASLAYHGQHRRAAR